MILHDAGDEIERVYFPHSGMVWLVAVMQSGAAVETATIGRAGVIGASTGLGVKYSFARAMVQLPGTAAWLSASQFHAAANGSQAIRDLIVHYSGMLLAQVQQSVACNVLHSMEARLCRWLLQAHDCMDGNDIPLTQEFLGQMLGVRRTTVTLAAQLLQSAGLIRYRRGHIQILDRPALERCRESFLERKTLAHVGYAVAVRKRKAALRPSVFCDRRMMVAGDCDDGAIAIKI